MTEQIQNNSKSVALLIWDRLLDTFDSISMQIITQCTSGRWILTVAAAAIMVKVCWHDINNAKEFKEIIAVIIYAYFQRGDRNPQTDQLPSKGDMNVKNTTINQGILSKTVQESTSPSV